MGDGNYEAVEILTKRGNQKKQKGFSSFIRITGLCLLVTSCIGTAWFGDFSDYDTTGIGIDQEEYSFIGRLKDTAISEDVSGRHLPDTSLHDVRTS